MLSIDSIVQLHDGTQKLMILNRAPLINDGERIVRYDYSACKYPVGLNPQKVFYFNESNIEKVVFKGYHDESEDKFDELYQQWLEEEGSQIPQGEVIGPLEGD